LYVCGTSQKFENKINFLIIKFSIKLKHITALWVVARFKGI